MDKKNIKEISDKKFKIKNTVTGEITTIVPKAVESCMNPGTFKVTPVAVCESEDEMFFGVAESCITFSKNEINAGKIFIEEEEFTPTIIRRSGGCKPCTNCGACSW